MWVTLYDYYENKKKCYVENITEENKNDIICFYEDTFKRVHDLPGLTSYVILINSYGEEIAIEEEAYNNLIEA